MYSNKNASDIQKIGSELWLGYIKTNKFLSNFLGDDLDFKKVLNAQLSSYKYEIADADNELQLLICGGLERSFQSIIQYHLGNNNSQLILNNAGLFDWNFWRLIEVVKLSQLAEAGVEHTMGMPGFQEDRKYYTEQGLQFLKVLCIAMNYLGMHFNIF